VAAAGSKAADLAGRRGDGIIGTKPDPELLEQFDGAGGAGKPRYGKLTVCWAESEAEARLTAHEWWPNSALHGELGQELPLPRHFEQATAQVTQEQVAKSVLCTSDPAGHIEAVQEFVAAGYDHVFVHQVGPDQEGFLAFYEDEVTRLAAPVWWSRT
jgi:coenzyme F420-dependent glucose-6-phosphate dehydrogenase